MAIEHMYSTHANHYSFGCRHWTTAVFYCREKLLREFVSRAREHDDESRQCSTGSDASYSYNSMFACDFYI